MLLRHGLVSADSHACLTPDAFVSRMSRQRWGERVPQVREVEQNGQRVQRWVVDGRVMSTRAVVNCAAVMDDPLRRTFPQRWEDVPEMVYDPVARLRAIDADGVDGEVLFFNDPLDSLTLPFLGDAEYELACVRAYNDALAGWRQASDHYIPLALIPYLSGGARAAAEVARAVEIGHRGVVMVAEPSMVDPRLPHLTDPAWDPLWDTCQELGVPVNWHAHAGVRLMPAQWQTNQALRRTAAFMVQPQFIGHFLLSGLADRFPRLILVSAETGTGWLAYVMHASDRQWERERLWRSGAHTRPSDIVRRQVRATFWYERSGIRMRELIDVNNILWASDYPHGTSSYPDSWQLINSVLTGVDEADRRKLLCENTLRVYGERIEYAEGSAVRGD